MNVELSHLSELLKLAGPMKGVKSTTDPVAEARPALRLFAPHALPSTTQRRDNPARSYCSSGSAHLVHAGAGATRPAEWVVYLSLPRKAITIFPFTSGTYDRTRGAGYLFPAVT